MKLGDYVRIRCSRPHKEQFNGSVGQIATITEKDIVYVCVGRYQPNFFMEELEVIAAPVEGGAK